VVALDEPAPLVAPTPPNYSAFGRVRIHPPFGLMLISRGFIPAASYQTGMQTTAMRRYLVVEQWVVCRCTRMCLTRPTFVT